MSRIRTHLSIRTHRVAATELPSRAHRQQQDPPMVSVGDIQRQRVAHRRRVIIRQQADGPRKRYEEGVVPVSEVSEVVVPDSEDEVVVPETPDKGRSERSFEFPLSGPERGDSAPEVSFEFPLSGLKRLEDPDELKDNEWKDDEWKKRHKDLEKRYGKLEKRYGKLEKRYGKLEGKYKALREKFDNTQDLVQVLAKKVLEDV